MAERYSPGDNLVRRESVVQIKIKGLWVTIMSVNGAQPFLMGQEQDR